MKKNFLFFLLFFFTVIQKGQGQAPKYSFSGRITDAKTGLPLPGASVYISDLKKGAAAGADGNFVVSNLSTGQWLVEISFLGYSTIIETISFNGDIKKDYALNPSVIENEGITVTGVSAATSVKRTPIPVSILRKEELFRNISTNLIDNISKTPGVSQVSTGPAVSKPFIRGLGYNRVVIVNDGIRHEGQQWGDEHGVEIDEQSANKVEILKGPASLMYGSDALAGVINIISVQPAGEGNIKGALESAYFTNNRQRNLHVDLDGDNNGFIWGVYGSFKAAADYRNKLDGYVFNSKFNEQNAGGYIGLNKSWGYTHLVFSNFNQHFGLVEGERDPVTGRFLKPVNDNGVESQEIVTESDNKSTDPFIPRQHLQHLKILSDNNIKLGKNRLMLTAGYQHDRRQEFGNILDPDERSLYFDLNVFNYNLQYHFAEHQNWKTTIGLNGMYGVNKNKGVESLIPAYNLFDIGGFIYAQKKIKEVTVSGGIRFDNRNIDTKSFNNNYSNISGSIGLAWQASKRSTIKFNIARGFRAPSIPELASNGAHEGTNRFEYGELNLRSEKSWQADAGLEVATEHVSFNGSIFYNAVNDFIYYRKLEAAAGGDSIITIGNETFYAFRFNQDNAHLYGAEFNLDFHPHPLDWLHIQNTFSWVRGVLNKKLDGSNNLPFIPAARLINEIKVDFLKKGKGVRNVFIMAELDNTFAQKHAFTGFNTETNTPGYTLFNAATGGELKSKDKTLATIVFSVNNITDKAWQNHLSRLKYVGVYNMGRNFSVKLRIPFSILQQ